MLRDVVVACSCALALVGCSHKYTPGPAEVGAIPMEEVPEAGSRPETETAAAMIDEHAATVTTAAEPSAAAPPTEVATQGAAQTDAPPATDGTAAESAPQQQPTDPPPQAQPTEPQPAADSAPVPDGAPAATTDPAPPPAPRTPRIDVEFAGEEFRVSIDGQRVAKEHLRRTDGAIEVVSSSGAVLQSIPIPQPKEHPQVMIGLRFESPGKALAKHIEGDLANTSLVVAVLDGSPGFLAGIEDFDLVTAVNGDPHASPAAIREHLKGMAAGDSVTLTLRRGEITKDVTINAVPWKHVPLPAQLQPMPIVRVPSKTLQPVPGTPNAPGDTTSRGRPAPAVQRSATSAP